MSIQTSGLSPQYLDLIKKNMDLFEEAIIKDDITGASNILRYMIAIMIPEYRGELYQEYLTMVGDHHRINAKGEPDPALGLLDILMIRAREKEGSNLDNNHDLIEQQKGVLYGLFTDIMDKLHTQDAFKLKVQHFGGPNE